MAIIGPSGIRTAIPFESPPGGLFGDGKSHIRLAMNAMSELQANILLRKTIESGIPEIYIDAFPYTLTFRREAAISAARSRAGLGWLIHHLQGVSELARAGFNVILRNASMHFLPDDDLGMNRIYNGHRKNFSIFFPWAMRQPEDPDTLRNLLAMARQRGTCIVFLVSPRSRTVGDYVGPSAMAALKRHNEEFAVKFGVKIWMPALTWDNRYFHDPGHVNFEGRKHYIQSLAHAEERCK
jgi:hypothetical protein